MIRAIVVRHPQNPILTPAAHTFYSRAVYNPVVWRGWGMWWLWARCEAEGDPTTGRIGVAQSGDGVSFSFHPEPVVVPEHDYEARGCEDPRVVRLGERFVMTYVGNARAYGGGRICLATSEDGFRWEKHGPVLQPRPGRWNAGQVKAGAICPFPVRGKYAMFFLGEQQPWRTAIGIAFSDDLVHWEEPDDNVVLTPRSGYFDSLGVEPGPPPVLTREGILLVYNGWDARHVHCVGAALLDPEDPRRVIARTEMPLLRPEMPWERQGQVADVVFATGLVYDPPAFRLYYGAADRVVGLATVQLFFVRNGKAVLLEPILT